MDYTIRTFEETDLQGATALWNEILAEGDSFPGDKLLTEEEALIMFSEQTETVCALQGGEVVGLHILHPNNIGRCSHYANASYAVKKEHRGAGIGRALVIDSLRRAKAHGFHGMQFNAVVASNYRAVTLYLKLGFTIIGTLKNGFRLKDGTYSDTLVFLKTWWD